jgi:hypothetical protein
MAVNVSLKETAFFLLRGMGARIKVPRLRARNTDAGGGGIREREKN